MNIKPDNYISIQGWMITELGLKNSELMIYALIYGFSQDRRSAFTGSLSYLMEWTQSSKQTVLTAIKALIGRGLIARIDVNVGGTKAVGYFALPHGEDDARAEGGDDGPKIRPNSQNFRPMGSKNLTDGVQKLDPINNNINKSITNIADNIPASSDADAPVSGEATSIAEDLSAEFEDLWKMYPRKQGKAEAKRAYIAARRSGTSYQTVRAGIEAYNAKIKAEQPLMRYVIHGGNWFEGRRWEDDNTPAPDGGSADRREKRQNRALNYKQRRYTKEDLKRFGIDFGEDDVGEDDDE